MKYNIFIEKIKYIWKAPSTTIKMGSNSQPVNLENVFISSFPSKYFSFDEDSITVNLTGFLIGNANSYGSKSTRSQLLNCQSNHQAILEERTHF